ncbi:MAG: thiamine pyrophosphate-dependent enzyme [Bacteroidetes bacterium]|nr:thiamine pyrophosphate-dependent enzyme [Bacteroidota bacterium]
MKDFLTDAALPFCKGCGHNHVAVNTEKALQLLGYDPLNVVLVTDIGCHGIIDKSFLTHTVHGLHGRSVALATGISAALNDPGKKVIVFIGDGGATIGMQHLIDAAHNGFNMTVVIHNNMLYGMTGGQPSEFTPSGFKTPTLPEGGTKTGYDICKIISAVDGVSYVSRLEGISDFSEPLAEAFSRKGFSLVEVMEICPSYGVKSNPGMKLSNVVENAGLSIKKFVDKETEVYKTGIKKDLQPLFSESDAIVTLFPTKLEKPVRLMLCGSAGEGVQAAAEFLLKAGMTSGLNGIKKGSYPVTVGVGFSAAEVILSSEEILYTGSPNPDILCVTSADGLEYARKTLSGMKGGKLFIDSSLQVPETKAEIISFPFRERGGAKNSSIYGIFYLLMKTGMFPMEALLGVFNENKIAKKFDVDKMFQLLNEPWAEGMSDKKMTVSK